MSQKELARRAGEHVNRVHKFVNGDLPYPPLTFLQHVFGVFGLTLPEALSSSPPVRPLSISRQDVLEVARLLEALDEAYVRSLKDLVEKTRRVRSGVRGGGTRRGP